MRKIVESMLRLLSESVLNHHEPTFSCGVSVKMTVESEYLRILLYIFTPMIFNVRSLSAVLRNISIFVAGCAAVPVILHLICLLYGALKTCNILTNTLASIYISFPS